MLKFEREKKKVAMLEEISIWCTISWKLLIWMRNQSDW